MKLLLTRFFIIAMLAASCVGGGEKSSKESNSNPNSDGFTISGTVTSISEFILSDAVAADLPNCSSTCNPATNKCAILSLVESNSVNDIQLCKTVINSDGKFKFALSNQEHLKNYMVKITSNDFKESKREILEYVNPAAGSVSLPVSPITTANVDEVREFFRVTPDDVKNKIADNNQILKNDLINMCSNIITAQNALTVINNKKEEIASPSRSSLILNVKSKLNLGESIADLQSEILSLCNSLIATNTPNLVPHLLSGPANGGQVKGVSVGTKIYFSGNDMANGVIDIIDTTTGAHTRDFLPHPRSGIETAVVGNSIYFIGGMQKIAGGYTNSTHIDIYNTITNTWSSQSMSKVLMAYTVAVMGTKLIIAGGWYRTQPSTLLADNKEIEIIDTTNWSRTTKQLISGHSVSSSAVVGNKLYIIGGTKDGYNPQIKNPTIDIYDSVTGTVSTMNLPRSRVQGSALVHGTKIYINGIQDDNIGSSIGTVDILETSNNTWTWANIFHHKGAHTAGKVGNYIFYAGGDVGYHPTPANYIISLLNLTTNVWSQIPFPRGGTSIGVAINNGKAYLGGGMREIDNTNDVIDVFNPVTGIITPY